MSFTSPEKGHADQTTEIILLCKPAIKCRKEAIKQRLDKKTGVAFMDTVDSVLLIAAIAKKIAEMRYFFLISYVLISNPVKEWSFSGDTPVPPHRGSKGTGPL